MANYVKLVPRDLGGGVLHNYPSPIKALTASVLTNALTSSVLNLNPNTTQIEIGSYGGSGCVIRWVSVAETASVAPYGSVISSGLGANYDHYIPSSQWRQFVLPKDTQGIGPTGTGQAGSVNGLYQRVAIKNAGDPSSVLLTQY
jgi:hypothetical protein